jgi:hypothetical protein
MELIADDAARKALGENALETLRSQTGATEKTLAALEQLLPVQTAAAGSSKP